MPSATALTPAALRATPPITPSAVCLPSVVAATRAAPVVAALPAPKPK